MSHHLISKGLSLRALKATNLVYFNSIAPRNLNYNDFNVVGNGYWANNSLINSKDQGTFAVDLDDHSSLSMASFMRSEADGTLTGFMGSNGLRLVLNKYVV